jgi:UDP-N-acetylmuramyl pentapeptide phosphotransferase/UDP-N-acetylglucosamine-1-phosphate transferase
MILFSIFIAFLVALAGTRWFCDPASPLHILDHPNERSLHDRPIPRSGGVAVLAGVVAGWSVLWIVYPASRESSLLLLTALPVTVISFLEDRFGVHQTVRLAAHLLAAVLLILSGYVPSVLELPGLPWACSGFTIIIGVVWMVNLYNFMDGMDGFAGGMAVIGFTTFAVLGAIAGHTVFASASLLIVAAVMGFLPFNFPPAHIFLGDTGSSTLGFLAAAFSLWGTREGLFPLWLPVLIFSPFIVDATVTLGRRLARGEKIWLAHKTHYYQRLVQLGWGHRLTLLAESSLMLLCSLSAIWAVHLSAVAQLGLVGIWVSIYTGLLIGVGRLERRWAKAKGQ